MTGDARDELLGVAAEVSAAMRKDVVPKDDQGKLDPKQLAKDVAERARSLSKPGVTTEEDFMARCADNEERRFYKDVLAFLAQKRIRFTWCSSGFSIKKRAGTSVVWCAPASAKQRAGIDILREKLTAGAWDKLASFLTTKGIEAGRLDGKRIRLRHTELGTAELCQVLNIATE